MIKQTLIFANGLELDIQGCSVIGARGTTKPEKFVGAMISDTPAVGKDPAYYPRNSFHEVEFNSRITAIRSIRCPVRKCTCGQPVLKSWHPFCRACFARLPKWLQEGIAEASRAAHWDGHHRTLLETARNYLAQPQPHECID